MQLADEDTTAKWLWRAADGAQVETVLMQYTAATVCVSAQAGCAMGCTFCATGQAGFERHLSAGEIVEQVLRAEHASGRNVSNVVFMGMGEPLANVDAVLDACTRLHDDVGISARHLTVSTVGVVPGIERLTEFELPVTLAVSLHAPDDVLREQLVPLNRRYPLAAVLDAARAYAERKGRRVSFEYACISGVNDLPQHAAALAGRLTGFRGGAHVNLIPLNGTVDTRADRATPGASPCSPTGFGQPGCRQPSGAIAAPRSTRLAASSARTLLIPDASAWALRSDTMGTWKSSVGSIPTSPRRSTWASS